MSNQLATSLILALGFVVAACAAAGAQSAASNQAPVVSFSWSPRANDAGDVCAKTWIKFVDASYDPEGTDLMRVWTLDGSEVFRGQGFAWNFDALGVHEVTLAVTDTAGAGQKSSSTQKLNVFECSTAAAPVASSEPSNMDRCKYLYEKKSSMDPETWATMWREYGCDKYYPAEPATSSGGSTSNYDPERCKALVAKRDAYIADWKYRYQSHYADGPSPSPDPEFETMMEREKNAFQSPWEQEWKAAGCDLATGGPSLECRSKYEAASADLAAWKNETEAAWGDYREDLNAARNEFAANSSHTSDDWAAFEREWKSRAAALAEERQAALRAILAQYGLNDCGYFGEAKPTFDAPASEAPPPAVKALLERHRECQAKAEAIKAEYRSRFEDLETRLRATDSETARMEILHALEALMKEARERMTAAMASCEQEAKQDAGDGYQDPANYKDRQGSLECFLDPATGHVLCKGKYVAFEGDPQTQILSQWSCGGQLFFSRLYASEVLEAFRLDSAGDGAELRISGADLKMLLHDGPRGLIHVNVVGGAVVSVVPADYLNVTVGEAGHKVLMEGAGSRGAWLSGDGGLSWDPASRVLNVSREATWVAESCIPTGADPEPREGGKYWDAIEKRKLGAQVTITIGQDDEADQDNESYSDVEVKVRREGGASNRYRADIDSEEGTCKTVALKFDGSIFSTIKLKVVLEAVQEDGTTSEVPITEASSLDDVLDPCDDGPDGFEYWIVQDKFGTQVLVSFAHFSEKRVSVEAASVGNLVVPGFGAEIALAAAGLGLLGLGLRRRLTR